MTDNTAAAFSDGASDTLAGLPAHPIPGEPDFDEKLREHKAAKRVRTRRARKAVSRSTSTTNGDEPWLIGPTAPNVRAWMRTAVTEETTKLRNTPRGNRNTEANNVALRLARIGCDRNWLRDAVLRECGINGVVRDDGADTIENTVSSAFARADADGPADDIPEPKWPDADKSPGEFEQNPDPVYADQLLTRSDLLMLPDPEPLINNVLDQGTTALLYGKWGTAKTFVTFDWAASVATGRNWQGRTTRQRRTLYVVGEGAFGFKGRIAAWEIGWQTKIDDDSLSILPFPVNLTNAADVNNLRALVAWGGYSFVIFDTLARCMVGADENSAQDCGIVIDAMTKILASTPGGRGVVLGVHHAGKDGKTLRGSSAFESGADTVYFASRDETLISLTREKRKDGPENDSHLLIFDPMPGTGSGVMSVSRGMSQGGETAERAATLRSIMSQSFRLTGASSTQLRQIAVDDGPMTRATFYRALSDLLESGWLINTGSEKRPFYFIRETAK